MGDQGVNTIHRLCSYVCTSIQQLTISVYVHAHARTHKQGSDENEDVKRGKESE